MAAVTHAATATWSTTAGTTTTPTNTATPALGDLIVVIAPSTGVVTSAVTDNNADGLGAYTKIGSTFTGFSTSGNLTVWVRNALIGSATSTVFTAPQNGSTGGGLDVFRVSGMIRTGSGAVRGSGGQSAGTLGTTPAPVLSLTPLTGNPVITAACNGTNPGGVTQPASYTEPTNLGYNSPPAGLDTAFINSGITSATITWGSTSATAFASVAIELDTSVPAGPVFTQSPRPVQAKIPAYGQRMAGPGPCGRAYGISAGAPVQNPPPPPPPGLQNVVRETGYYYTGRIGASYGARVTNPTQGPPFYPRPFPVQAQDLPPRRGRVYATPKPVTPSVPARTGPAFYPFTSEVRSAFPQQPLLRGRAASSPGGPVANPSVVAVSGAIPGAVRASLPVNLRGRVRVVPSAVTVRPVHAGPPFYPAVQAVRARLPLQPLLRGRTASNAGSPPRNPGSGPAVYPLQGPVRARTQSPFSEGRARSNAGAAVRNPGTGPAFRQAVRAARAVIPQVFSKGRVSSGPGAPLANPGAGPVFRAAVKPARVPVPQSFSKGRVSSGRGAPIQNPSHGPVFTQAVIPARARTPLPPRGRTASNPGGPVQNPVPGITGPPFFPSRSPARARIPQNGPRGRTASGPGAPVRNPSRGPVFRQAAGPARTRVPQVFSRGRAAGSPGAAVYSGPPFRQAASPARIRPSLPPRGRIASNAGGPVQNPPPVVTGPVFRQATSPARIRPGLPPRGRITSCAGAPVRNPSHGPVFLAAVRPVRAPVPQPFSKGRVSANPGAPPPRAAPVYPQHGPARARIIPPPRGRTGSNPGTAAYSGPVFRPLNHPVQARFPLPPRGRTSGNPGIPVAAAPKPVPVYPLHGPVQARRPLPPHGRVITGNPGAPRRNPQAGPRFTQAVRPCRCRVPQNAPRGRTASGPGGPVQNKPFNRILIATGDPFTLWATSGPVTAWDTGDPFAAWETGSPFTTE